jgi:hypothetical protein
MENKIAHTNKMGKAVCYLWAAGIVNISWHLHWHQFSGYSPSFGCGWAWGRISIEQHHCVVHFTTEHINILTKLQSQEFLFCTPDSKFNKHTPKRNDQILIKTIQFLHRRKFCDHRGNSTFWRLFIIDW